MAETQESVVGVVEKLAMLSEATTELFPNGKVALIFELDETDFKSVQGNFRDVDRAYKQFKIDISGVEFMFLSDTSLNDGIDIVLDNQPTQEVRKGTFFGRLKNLLRIGNRSDLQK